MKLIKIIHLKIMNLYQYKKLKNKMPNGNKIDLLAEKHNFGFIKINK
jgi:hypothetical protein